MATGDLNIKKHGEYEFVCWYWQQGNAWGHECRLCKTGEKAGYELSKYRTRYYNRTWEKYTYQSVMYGALEEYKKQELSRAKSWGDVERAKSMLNDLLERVD